ncbi:MAG: dTMP kinase [Clostridia bacterium]|nr:dTMP kinase [Clostridia bacterium]
MSGRFIVFEGIDGSGKTTQLKLLAERFRSEGKKVYMTAEPTDMPSGKALREALGGRVKKSEWDMALMFVSDRIEHNINAEFGIKKKLDEDYYVICDRYYYSTLAYQGYSTDYAWVKGMNLDCPEIIRPDICIYLDLLPSQSLERISAGRDNVEIYENEDTLRRVREKFLSVIEDIGVRDNIRRIDAYRTIEEIADDVYSVVCECFEE